VLLLCSVTVATSEASRRRFTPLQHELPIPLQSWYIGLQLLC
jgi:hypothetical protein